MEWTEINKKAIELAYEVLKKLNSEHAEEFNPENHNDQRTLPDILRG